MRAISSVCVAVLALGSGCALLTKSEPVVPRYFSPEAADPAALRAEISARIESARGPVGPLTRFQMEEMIDPRDTRPLVCEWAKNAYRIISQPDFLRPRALQFRP